MIEAIRTRGLESVSYKTKTQKSNLNQGNSLIRWSILLRRVPPSFGPFLPSLVALGALHEI